MAPSPHQGLWGAFARQFQLAPNARLPCHSSLPSCLADPAAPQNLPGANGACFRRPSVLRTKVIPAGAYAGDGGARQSFASPDFRRARQKDAHRLTRARPSHGLPRPERWAKRPAHRRQPPPDRRASPQPRDAARGCCCPAGSASIRLAGGPCWRWRGAAPGSPATSAPS